MNSEPESQQITGGQVPSPAVTLEQSGTTIQAGASQSFASGRENRGFLYRLYFWKRRARVNPLDRRLCPARYRDGDSDANWLKLCAQAEVEYERYLYFSDSVLWRDVFAWVLSAATVVASILTAYSSAQEQLDARVVNISAFATVLVASLRGLVNMNARHVDSATAAGIYTILVVAKNQWLSHHNKVTSGEALKRIIVQISEASDATENKYIALEQSMVKAKEA